MWKSTIWFAAGLLGALAYASATGAPRDAMALELRPRPVPAATEVGLNDVEVSEEAQTVPAEPAPTMAAVQRWRFDAYFELPEVPEPSGLAWCDSRGTLFTVDDGGPGRPPALYEVSLEGEVLGSLAFGTDLEGVTWSPVEERLYVCDEHDERIYVVDVSAPELELLGSFQVSRFWRGREVLTAGGNGFEGVEWVPGESGGLGALLILNQDDPTALLLVELARAELDAVLEADMFWLLPQRNSGALHLDADAGELWVVHSWLNTLGVLELGHLTADAAAVPPGEWPAELPLPLLDYVRWEVVPGLAQEGVAVDPYGRMWVAQDTGGLVRYVR